MEPSWNAEDLEMEDSLQNNSPMQLFPPTPDTVEMVAHSARIIPDQDEGGLILFPPLRQVARLSNETTPEVNPLQSVYREMTPEPVSFSTPESRNITFRKRGKRGLPYSHFNRKYGLQFGNNLFR